MFFEVGANSYLSKCIITLKCLSSVNVYVRVAHATILGPSLLLIFIYYLITFCTTSDIQVVYSIYEFKVNNALEFINKANISVDECFVYCMKHRLLVNKRKLISDLSKKRSYLIKLENPSLEQLNCVNILERCYTKN